jgi:hypothetical protein
VRDKPDIPGLATPWPDARRFPVTRRLLALWRWEWERGPDSEAACNARRSVEERVAPLGICIDTNDILDDLDEDRRYAAYVKSIS